MLTVTVENRNEVVVLHCAGRIVRGEETALLCAASRQNGRTLIVDLERVDGIDAAGIGALVALQAAGIYVQLMNPSAPVREVLRVTRVDSILEIGGPPPASQMAVQAVA
jgi:anti-anti-sigma factor